MKLHSPFGISSRLLPSLTVGGATISLEHVRTDREGRDVYRWYIDLPDGTEHSDNDLRTGCQGGSLQSVFASLLSFLSAAGESLRYCDGQGREPDDDDNASLFPAPVVEWASENCDEIQLIRCEIEDSETVLIEE